MTIHLPPELEKDIPAAVHDGRYASLDDAMSEAASLLLQRLKGERAGMTSDLSNLTEEQLEQQLVHSGFLASVPPHPGTVTAPWMFELARIDGEPLSETVIRERR